MWQVAEAESSEQQWQRRGDDSAAQPSHSLSVLNSVGGGIVVVGWGVGFVWSSLWRDKNSRQSADRFVELWGHRFVPKINLRICEYKNLRRTTKNEQISRSAESRFGLWGHSIRDRLAL
jgi:hypothetical protein